MTEEQPVRFTVPMKASFREVTTREGTIGKPMRWRMDDSVMMQGIVVDWTDEADGSITLTIEGAAPEA
jgi:hypothetical protein